MWGDFLTEAELTSLVGGTFQTMTPILLAAVGETVAEKSGVYNMGLEGTMLVAAFAAFVAAHATASTSIGLLAGMGAGVLVCALLAVLVLLLEVQQIISGLALNLLAVGLTGYLYEVLYGISEFPLIETMRPVLFNQPLLTYLAVLMVPVSSFLLFRTRIGLELRGVGENPRAVDTKGLCVRCRQFAALLFCGLMAGLGGAFLSLVTTARWMPDVTHGRGWLAITAVIAGGWRPSRVFMATLIYALLESFEVHAQVIGILVPAELVRAAPYVIALLLLVMRRVGSGAAPAMLGVLYKRG